MTKGAIFDFNGTLFWDTEFHMTAFEVFARRYENGIGGLTARHLSKEMQRDHIMGRTNRQIMDYIFDADLDRATLDALNEEKESVYRDMCRGKVHWAPGAEELFRALSANSVAMNIASSAGKTNFDMYYAEIGDIEHWFPRGRIVINDGSFTNGKPAPDIFLLAAERIGVPPCDCVVFEDSVAGVQAAEAAGCDVIIVNSDPYNLPPVQVRGDHPVITDFRQALPLLGL